ncbi:MAG: hypothetical protein PT118_26060, partial [Aphanizomenon gracile PMC644.10]|nr:hypothetical protein [Aphanizomenon gracile PMC644.10]
NASTSGKGDAGNIAIKATEGVNVRGELNSRVNDKGEGNSGGITIDTSTLTLENDGFISASNFGIGNAGNITIKATEGVTVGGALTSDVEDTAQGNGGNITIKTSNLTLENGGKITTDTYGIGDAGNIAIKATQGVHIRGRLTSDVKDTAKGTKRSITIDTSTLILENGGFISADTFGKGDAGNIEIKATQGVTIGGLLTSEVTDTGVGNSGGITIDTSTLTVDQGGFINASTSGKGNAGKIEIQATEGVNVRGALNSEVLNKGEGNSGGITIDTSTLTLENGGFITADTYSIGDAGNVAIKATQGVNVRG